MDPIVTIVVALLASVIAPSIIALINGWMRHGEKKAEWAREDEVARRAELVRIELLKTTAANNLKLIDISSVINSTHKIVNNQRTMLLVLNAELRERIARENPQDLNAQDAAIEARQEANRAIAANLLIRN